MRSGSIENAVSDGLKADIVLMIQFLEHAADPVATLRSAAKLLNPNGVVYIGVPGLKSMILGGWGDKLAGTLQNAHLFLFELETLDIAASKAGLKRLWGSEECTAIYALNPQATTAPTALVNKPRGDETLRYIALLERTSILWGIIWKICGGPISKASYIVRRIGAAVARRLGYNI